MLSHLDLSAPDMVRAPAAPLSLLKLPRRGFLAGASALIGIAAFAGSARAFEPYATGGEDMPGGIKTDPLLFVTLHPDGTVEIVTHRSEMGTGIRTSLPMVVADEMQADWDHVTITQAEGDEEKWGNQNTDGSRSMRHHIQAARQIGASIRHMVRAAAAERWGIDPSEVTVADHAATALGRKIGFGDLAEAAMAQPVPAFEALEFTPEDRFRYIGKGNVQITDLHDITTGAAVYGADVMLDGMLTAVVARTPVVGGSHRSYDASATLATPGVRSVHEIPYSTMPAGFAPLGGIAVVADNTWAAEQGRLNLTVDWDPGPNGVYNSGPYMEEMRATAEQPGVVKRAVGDVDAAFASAASTWARTYTQAHMAHAPMEPPAALANVTADGCELWVPTQNPAACRNDVAATLGMDPAQVKVNVTLLGGGFGRKSKHDFAIEAAILSQATGRPVRVQWTREDDIRHSFMHTTSAERISVAADDAGNVTGWRHNSVAPSIVALFAPDAGYQFPVETGMGHADTPFDVPNILAENGKAMAHTRIGWYRAVSNVPRAWAIGSAVGEYAAETGTDELEMWLKLIGPARTVTAANGGLPEDLWNYGEPAGSYDIDTGRMANVLRRAAERIGWGREMPEGEGLGLAVHRSFVTYVAVATHVKVVDGRITVPETVMSVDCGFAANPERIESQMQGAAVMGMTLALHSSVTYRDGAVEQSNYFDYPVVMSNNFPRKVTVDIVEHPFAVHAAGVGEPGVPPIAPAIANALYHATGVRKRDLPMGEMV